MTIIMNNKKVNILSQYYYPDIASTAQLLTELAGELALSGMDVSVYSAKPAYHKKGDAPSEEVHNGVKILRTYCTNANKNTIFGRTINTLSFIVSISIKLLFSERKAVNLIVSNPPFLHFIGYLLYLLRKQKYVLLIYDIYPDVAVTLGYFNPGSIIVRIWNWFYKKTIEKSAKTIVLSEGMKELILSKFQDKKIIENKMSIIHNWADDKFLRVIPKNENPFIKKNNLSGKFILLYSGNLALYNDFDTILAAAKQITDPSILFLLIGDGGRRKEIEKYIVNNSLQNVKIMDYLPLKDLPYSISSGDALFISVRDGINGINMPSKLYTIMACGKPMLALGMKGGDVNQMIDNAGCGIFIEQGDVEGLIKAIDYYRNNPEAALIHGSNGRKYLENHYTLKIISQEYYELLSGIE